MSPSLSRPAPIKRANGQAAKQAGGQARQALRPIGVFDSGVGGLTVAAALRKLLPGENIFYIGDTARVPYGEKAGRPSSAIPWKSPACSSPRTQK